MKRLLSAHASDFGKTTTSADLKDAILASEGRTIITEIGAESLSIFPEVSNLELAKAFGADLVFLKGLNFDTPLIAGVNHLEGNLLTEARKLCGLGLGLSLEITDDLSGNQFTKEHLAKAIALQPDFIGLTAYVKPEISRERIVQELDLVRDHYTGFLLLHPVCSHGRNLNIEDLKTYVEHGADLIVLPAPGAVPGVTETRLQSLADVISTSGALVHATISTSQEGADEATIRELSLAAKRAGVDGINLGDAGICGMAAPENIQTVSLAIRGKRHTYTRMARSILK